MMKTCRSPASASIRAINRVRPVWERWFSGSSIRTKAVVCADRFIASATLIAALTLPGEREGDVTDVRYDA